MVLLTSALKAVTTPVVGLKEAKRFSSIIRRPLIHSSKLAANEDIAAIRNQSKDGVVNIRIESRDDSVVGSKEATRFRVVLVVPDSPGEKLRQKYVYHHISSY
ncbi:MAG: hypothetical protein R2827_12840 [Bdellovibrionales bacterium]